MKSFPITLDVAPNAAESIATSEYSTDATKKDEEAVETLNDMPNTPHRLAVPSGDQYHDSPVSLATFPACIPTNNSTRCIDTPYTPMELSIFGNPVIVTEIRHLPILLTHRDTRQVGDQPTWTIIMRLDGETVFMLAAATAHKIITLKSMTQDLGTDIPVEDTRFIMSGKQIPNENTVLECGLVECSTIWCTLSVTGRGRIPRDQRKRIKTHGDPPA